MVLICCRNCKIRHFQFLYLTNIFHHFLLIYNFSVSNSLSFNYTSFNYADNNITYERAFVADQVIKLAGDKQAKASLGRATYFQPVQLYHKETGKLTDFTTHFSFVIDSDGRGAYGDGLAFFLAPQGTRLNPNITKGGSMGLTLDDQQVNPTGDPFVAVEFDIYNNTWDPPHEHVGIDVNSMRSVANVSWLCNIKQGKKNDAWISYDSSAKNLSVVFTGFRNNVTVEQYLSYQVDLSIHLPEKVTIGFTAATGNATAIHSIYSWDFSSSLEVVSNNVPGEDEGPPQGSPNRSSKGKVGLGVGLGVGGFVLVCGFVLVGFGMWKRKRDKEDHIFDKHMDDEFQRGTGMPKKFTYKELACATSNFKDEEKLGQGGFGGVYKGFLRDLDSYVAVKRVSKDSTQGIKEYASEIKIISRLRHKNLVQLIGWCHERKELLLVYEFMPNGSLDSHLFKAKNLLIWKVRYKIAQGLASALLYLHEEWEQCVVHRDIKSSNIMLDSNFNAKLGDFGLARFVDHTKGSQTTVLAGTMGYMAPEMVTMGKASKESDMYSFGVVALEIACGRKPINTSAPEDEVMMVEWVWELYGIGKVLEAVDQRLGGVFDEKEMERLMIVGLWCAHPDHNLRPSIRQVIQVLNFEAPLPILPLNMPVPTYLTPPRNRPSSKEVSVGNASFECSSSQLQNSSSSYNTNSSQFTQSSPGYSPSKTLLYTH
ncbi:hypothetical protein FNV43_RR22966 [Rhamnella rubrinervis]|uniref:Protein kinase domain-containing protein n=1 Tax=Rhamnella rubrinervis TaxID=2594499 RepID=A0A8K0DXL5_9ROSA|nr:hypothetical protein FNV43_RR22966 [Rhamnella rubrinervis]